MSRFEWRRVRLSRVKLRWGESSRGSASRGNIGRWAFGDGSGLVWYFGILLWSLGGCFAFRWCSSMSQVHSRVEWSRGGLRGLRGKVSIYIYMIQVIGCACWNLYIFPFATYYLFTRIENWESGDYTQMICCWVCGWMPTIVDRMLSAGALRREAEANGQWPTADSQGLKARARGRGPRAEGCEPRAQAKAVVS